MIQETDNSFEEIKTVTNKFLLNTYARFNVAFKYGSGTYLYDTTNKRYIDFMCGISVTSLGHSEPDIIEALRAQSDKIVHSSNLFYSEEQAKLAEVLINHSFPGKVFLANSGTEANEAAFKLARKYAISKGKHKPVIIALKGSFHGRTTAGMSMTGQDKIKQGYGDLLGGIEYVNPGKDDDLIHAFDVHGENIAAVIIEPIQGEIGIKPVPDSFASLARKLTMETESLLIFDEIQTGMGRTGKLFAYEHYGFTPDVMTLAKALGSGFPIGAMIVAENFADTFTKGSHGSTFGGNHLAAAVAYETIKIIMSRDILKNVNETGEFFFKKLNQMKDDYKIIKEVRGKGLHIGIEFTIPTRQIAEECLQAGLVVNSTNENVIRIMPPLNIINTDAEEGLKIFEEIVIKFNKEA